MKKIIVPAVLFAALSLNSCVTSGPPSNNNSSTSNSSMSVEAEARQKTEQMAKLLSLTASQKDQVMVTNTVHMKLLRNLRTNNESNKISSANESYKTKIKSILDATQYAMFEKEMGDM